MFLAAKHSETHFRCTRIHETGDNVIMSGGVCTLAAINEPIIGHWTTNNSRLRGSWCSSVQVRRPFRCIVKFFRRRQHPLRRGTPGSTWRPPIESLAKPGAAAAGRRRWHLEAAPAARCDGAERTSQWRRGRRDGAQRREPGTHLAPCNEPIEAGSLRTPEPEAIRRCDPRRIRPQCLRCRHRDRRR